MVNSVVDRKFAVVAGSLASLSLLLSLLSDSLTGLES